MKNSFLFDFTVDKITKTVKITREFNAEQSLLWDAFTKPEILDQWGAPKPWISKTEFMDFKVGGRRFYKMSSPEGQEHFSIQDYTSISPKTNLKYISNFADKDGNINPEFKGSENNVDFNEKNGVTTVTTTIKYESLEVLEFMVQKGFKEGVSMTFGNLENLLTNLSKRDQMQGKE